MTRWWVVLLVLLALVVAAGGGVTLILLHQPGGNVVQINPEQVTSMRQRRVGDGEHFTKEAECAISLVDGKYVTVVENCDEVKRLMEAAR